MKTLLIIIVAVFLFTSLSFASARAPKKMDAASFKNSAGWAKLDLRSKDAWTKAMADQAGGTVLECLLKTTQVATDDEKNILKAAGFKARTFVGSIITGSLSAKDLAQVANLKFVEVIELAVPLSIKK